MLLKSRTFNLYSISLAETQQQNDWSFFSILWEFLAKAGKKKRSGLATSQSYTPENHVCVFIKYNLQSLLCIRVVKSLFLMKINWVCFFCFLPNFKLKNTAALSRRYLNLICDNQVWTLTADRDALQIQRPVCLHIELFGFTKGELRKRG